MASIDDILLQMKKTPADVRFADLSKICIHISVALVRKAEVIMFTSCGECRAFTGRNFLEDEYRDLRFDTQKGKDYRAQCREQHGVNECGMCLWACPHGRKASQKLSGGNPAGTGTLSMKRTAPGLA